MYHHKSSPENQRKIWVGTKRGSPFWTPLLDPPFGPHLDPLFGQVGYSTALYTTVAISLQGSEIASLPRQSLSV